MRNVESIGVAVAAAGAVVWLGGYVVSQLKPYQHFGTIGVLVGGGMWALGKFA